MKLLSLITHPINYIRAVAITRPREALNGSVVLMLSVVNSFGYLLKQNQNGGVQQRAIAWSHLRKAGFLGSSAAAIYAMRFAAFIADTFFPMPKSSNNDRLENIQIKNTIKELNTILENQNKKKKSVTFSSTNQIKEIEAREI